jgi:hypothetical protein
MEQESDSAQSTTIYPELSRPVPRNVQMTGTGWANLLLLIIFFGPLAALLVYVINAASHDSAKRNTLRTGAGETLGQITREWTSGRSSTQHIAYAFEVNGATYSGESTVPDRIWKNQHYSAGVNIKYSPADPHINHPADWEDSIFGISSPLIGSVIFSIPGLVLIGVLRSQRRLVAEGLPALARVTERFKGGRGGRFLKYEFQTEAGEIVTGTCPEEKEQEIDSTIFVIYLPGKPRTSLPYPIETFKVDG